MVKGFLAALLFVPSLLFGTSLGFHGPLSPGDATPIISEIRLHAAPATFAPSRVWEAFSGDRLQTRSSTFAIRLTSAFEARSFFDTSNGRLIVRALPAPQPPISFTPLGLRAPPSL